MTKIYRKSLREQQLEKKNKSLAKMYERLAKDHQSLKDDYRKLEDNFYFLATMRTEEMRAFIRRYGDKV
jgi:hypothetical protein